MKKIIIIHSNMEIGGAETSLLGLLHSFDYNEVSVDLFLYNPVGELLELIPDEVNILKKNLYYQALQLPIKNVIFSKGFFIGVSRIAAKVVCWMKNQRLHYTDLGYVLKQRSHYYALPFLPNIDGKYDVAISFNDPHYVMGYKVNAKLKMGWFHTDFSRIKMDLKLELKMWNLCDYVVNVSEACKEKFDMYHPHLREKSIVVENILPRTFVEYQAKKTNFVEKLEGKYKLLSIGRFSEQKNFDNIPDICKKILSKGIEVKWYLIGYGSDEQLIRQKIEEANVEKNVILLGKKSNPYPYIANCDIYIQPSRYEGKAVTVREAQMLNKPVIITNYATARSQLEDGVDGVIVPLENEKCAEEICKLILDCDKQKELIENTKARDYSNNSEIKKIYYIISKL